MRCDRYSSGHRNVRDAGLHGAPWVTPCRYPGTGCIFYRRPARQIWMWMAIPGGVDFCHQCPCPGVCGPVAVFVSRHHFMWETRFGVYLPFRTLAIKQAAAGNWCLSLWRTIYYATMSWPSRNSRTWCTVSRALARPHHQPGPSLPRLNGRGRSGPIRYCYFGSPHSRSTVIGYTMTGTTRCSRRAMAAWSSRVR